MARVYEKDLMPSLAREMGDYSSPYTFDPNILFSAINDGLADFNEECVKQQYEVLGSGETAYFNPDPSSVDKRLITLYAAICILRSDQAKASRNAFIHSNAAGRTDFSKATEAIEFQITRLEKKIKRVWHKRARALVEKEMEDHGGDELRSKTTKAKTWVEGTPITTISTTV